MVFDIEAFQDEIRDTLRLYLYPESTNGTLDTTLSTDSNIIDVAQSFIPYSTLWQSVGQTAYTIITDIKLKKLGTPDDNILLSLVKDSSNTPMGDTLAVNTINVASIGSVHTTVSNTLVTTEKLVSKNKHWLKIEPQSSASTTDCYVIARDSNSPYLPGMVYTSTIVGTWNESNYDIYFDCSIPHWVYSSYPYIETAIHKYPRLAIDMVGRPTIEQRWIDQRMCHYTVDFDVTIRARYKDEVNDIISYVDRALFDERIDMSNFRITNPGIITPITVTADNKFSRAVRLRCTYKNYKT